MSPTTVYHKIVPSPAKPNHLPIDLHWLSGEGCGSWFHIEQKEDKFIISRFSAEGKAECKGIFNQISGSAIEINETFEFTYLSHCAEVNIIQNNQNLKFKLISKC